MEEIIYNHEAEVKHLKSIVEKIFGIGNLYKKVRMREYTEARAVFCKILHKERGYGGSRLGKIMMKNHATILHYLKTIDDNMRYDKELTAKYDRVYSVWKDNYDPIDGETNSDLKRAIYVLRTEKKELLYLLEELKAELTSVVKYKNVLDLLEGKGTVVDKYKYESLLNNYLQTNENG
jgi:hypothetical protein